MNPVAEIIAIGSELLTPQRLDTNSLFITAQLNLLGVDVVSKQVIGDDKPRLALAIHSALSRSSIVVLSGGLGPTEDDVTREAAAGALGRQLVFSEEQERILKERFRQIQRKMAENNLRQTYLIEGAEALLNAAGTAPGQWVEVDGKVLVLLPGPPRELKPMLVNQVTPKLAAILPKQVILTRSFRIAGMGESNLDALIAPIYTKYSNPATTVLSAIGDLQVHLIAKSEHREQAEALLKEVGDPIARLLGDKVYATDNSPLELVVGRMLRERNATVTTAESCTGGLLASRLTEHAGSSDFFVSSFVTYANGQKNKLLGVPEDMLAQYTAVSEPVARAMAEGARERTDSTYAISITGYAGPSGGTDENPVGTVFIGLAAPHGTTVTRYQQGADRERVRVLSVQTALDLLRREMLSH